MAKPSIEPVKWDPPPVVHRPLREISDLHTYGVPGYGPEDVLVDSQGRAYTGVDDGRIIRVDPNDDHATVVANTKGRPLGLEWLPDGRLLVCDATRGLLAVELNGAGGLEVLADTVDGKRIRLCNNAAVAADGTIWFTDSSARFDLEHWKADLLEHSGTGRLLRRDPNGETTTVLTGLHFANGVALSPDEGQLYLAQTGNYSLTRVNLTGSTQGSVVIDPALPGFPDNLSTGSDGLIWVAVASPRNALVDRLATLPGVLRKAAWALPDPLQPQPEQVVTVLVVDPSTDEVVRAYRTEHPKFGTSTGVREANGTVWLGSLVGHTIASFSRT